MEFSVRKNTLHAYLAFIACVSTSSVIAADGPGAIEASLDDSVIGEAASTGRTFMPGEFARFVPRNSLDMLNQVPGFSVRSDDQGRGFGQASTNVLINGQRLSSKSQNVYDQLRRVTASNVERIEIVDGATLDIPGLSGQVANVITRGGEISGSYEYRTVHRPKYAEPGWFGGEISVSGSTPTLEWNAAYTHGFGRGAAAGPGVVTDAQGNITEYRNIHSHFEGDFPQLTANFKWDGNDNLIANLNLQYSRDFTDFSNNEDRDLVNGVDQFRDFGNSGRAYGYEIGGDVEFGVGPGRLKLIGLDSLDDDDFYSDSVLIFADDRPNTGNRFARQSESRERIGRTEYQWDALGGNWQLDAEIAFNQLDQASQLYDLETNGSLVEIPLPNSTGQVTEDRYEVILTHGRTLTDGLSMQLGLGGENSELAQTGPGGLTRTFWRPKGSFSLAWTVNDSLDLSFNLARTVSQLSFDQFLAEVNLEAGNENVGNVQLRPTLNWESDLELEKSLGDWGSSNLRFYVHWSEDYIDVIPIPEGGESPGNIDNAQLYGMDWNSTINLDPLGWEGAKLDLEFTLEESSIDDPLTGISRSFSRHFDRSADISLRHDIPDSNWAWGAGLEYHHILPSYRLSEVVINYEGPTYTWAFIEHKDFFGMTASLNVFNLTDGRGIYNRTVYSGPRDSSPVLFIEDENLSVQPIFRFELTGNF